MGNFQVGFLLPGEPSNVEGVSSGTKSLLCRFLPVRLLSSEIGFLDCLMKGLDQQEFLIPDKTEGIPVISL